MVVAGYGDKQVVHRVASIQHNNKTQLRNRIFLTKINLFLHYENPSLGHLGAFLGYMKATHVSWSVLWPPKLSLGGLWPPKSYFFLTKKEINVVLNNLDAASHVVHFLREVIAKFRTNSKYHVNV